MPCRSDYMEATDLEQEHSKLICLMDELNTGEFPDPDKFGNGYDEDVYGNTTKEKVDKLTEVLCSKLQRFDEFGLKERSLELQVWWRDHKLHDKKRIENSLDNASNGVELRKIYNGLNEYELGLIDDKYENINEDLIDEDKFISNWLGNNLKRNSELNMNEFLRKFIDEYLNEFKK